MGLMVVLYYTYYIYGDFDQAEVRSTFSIRKSFLESTCFWILTEIFTRNEMSCLSRTLGAPKNMHHSWWWRTFGRLKFEMGVDLITVKVNSEVYLQFHYPSEVRLIPWPAESKPAFRLSVLFFKIESFRERRLKWDFYEGSFLSL